MITNKTHDFKDLEEQINVAKTHINKKAEMIRLSVITRGEGQILVYAKKAIQAEEYLSRGAPEDLRGFIYIEMDAKALDISPTDAAQKILENDAMWNVYFAKLDYERLLGKRLLTKCKTYDEVMGVLDKTIEKMEAVKPEKSKPGDVVTSVNGDRASSCCKHCTGNEVLKEAPKTVKVHEKETPKIVKPEDRVTRNRNLNTAKSEYREQYGENPVDCDPDGKGGWVCRGIKIGDSDPKKQKRRKWSR